MPDTSSTKLHSNPQGDFFRTDPAPPSAKTRRPYADPIFESPESRKETTQQVAKLAGRLNASAVTDKERDALLTERSKLLDKIVAGTITRKEEIRLEYVRWSLDRIEDARHGPAMDRLEGQIEEFRKLAAHLMGLRDNLDDLATAKKRR